MKKKVFSTQSRWKRALAYLFHVNIGETGEENMHVSLIDDYEEKERERERADDSPFLHAKNCAWEMLDFFVSDIISLIIFEHQSEWVLHRICHALGMTIEYFIIVIRYWQLTNFLPWRASNIELCAVLSNQTLNDVIGGILHKKGKQYVVCNMMPREVDEVFSKIDLKLECQRIEIVSFRSVQWNLYLTVWCILISSLKKARCIYLFSLPC